MSINQRNRKLLGFVVREKAETESPSPSMAPARCSHRRVGGFLAHALSPSLHPLEDQPARRPPFLPAAIRRLEWSATGLRRHAFFTAAREWGGLDRHRIA